MWFVCQRASTGPMWKCHRLTANYFHFLLFVLKFLIALPSLLLVISNTDSCKKKEDLYHRIYLYQRTYVVSEYCNYITWTLNVTHFYCWDDSFHIGTLHVRRNKYVWYFKGSCAYVKFSSLSLSCAACTSSVNSISIFRYSVYTFRCATSYRTPESHQILMFV